MRTDKIRKYVLPNIPYLFIGWACLKMGTAYRLAAGANLGEKLLGLMQTIGVAFADFSPGLDPFDWLIGFVGAVAFRLLIYFKSKNAKKFRRDEEYGSSRWGCPKAKSQAMCENTLFGFCFLNSIARKINFSKNFRIQFVIGFLYNKSSTKQEVIYMQKSSRRFRNGMGYHIMVLPMLILYLTFIIYPFLSTIFYSFTDYSSSKLFDYSFVGIKNYLAVFETKNQLDAIGHTLQYAVIITVVQAIVAVVLAVFLNKELKSTNLLRGIFFFPAVMSPLVVGYIWSFLFSTSSYGPINNLLTSFGLEKINFFGDPKIALYSIIFTQIWQWTGYNMVIVLANLQTIDKTYYEAAEVDGATGFQKFWRITLPLLYPSMNVVVVTSLIGGLKVYDIIISTTNGGPFYATTTIIQSIIGQAIGGGQYGLGAALSVLFLLIILAFTKVVMHFMDKWEGAISA